MRRSLTAPARDSDGPSASAGSTSASADVAGRHGVAGDDRHQILGLERQAEQSRGRLGGGLADHGLVGDRAEGGELAVVHDGDEDRLAERRQRLEADAAGGLGQEHAAELLALAPPVDRDVGESAKVGDGVPAGDQQVDRALRLRRDRLARRRRCRWRSRPSLRARGGRRGYCEAFERSLWARRRRARTSSSFFFTPSAAGSSCSDLLPGGGGVLVEAVLDEGVAQVLEDDRVFLGAVDGALELAQRLGVAALLVVGPAEAVDEVAVVRLEREGLADQRRRPRRGSGRARRTCSRRSCRPRRAWDRA